MKKIIIILSLISFSFILNSCATIVYGDTQDIPVNTDPPGATVIIKNKYGNEVGKFTTPCFLRLKKDDGFFSGNDYTFVFEKEGYESRSIFITSSVRPSYLLGNLGFYIFAPIGWLIVDPLSGAMWEYLRY